MPEQPEVTVYREALESRLVGEDLLEGEVRSPFLLRTFEPPLDLFLGRTVTAVSTIGKRIVLHFGPELAMVFHLMIAGRFRWLAPGKSASRQKTVLAWFQFGAGTLVLTEAGSKKRASLHLVEKSAALVALNPGGRRLDELSPLEFAGILRAENRTLKRALTNPKNFSGIGNAYSDEILHRAQLSPVARTHSLSDPQVERLLRAGIQVLEEWTDHLRKLYAGKFPTRVTAFRPEMAVHGKYREECPVCASPVMRIRHSSNETNYCPECQTGGKILKDRSLSLLLRDDWPRTIEEWES